MSKKAVIFDLDGTLINAYPAIYSSFNHTMKACGLPVKSKMVIRRAVGWGDRNLLKPFVPVSMLSKALRIYRGHHSNALLKGSRLYPFVRDLLRKLKKKGFLLAVASNRPTKFSLIILKHLQIRGYFDYVLCGDKLQNIKPHPEILRTVLKKFFLSPKDAFYVGDMEIDALTGKRAGIKTIIVTTGSGDLPLIRSHRPFKIIKSLDRLIFIL